MQTHWREELSKPTVLSSWLFLSLQLMGWVQHLHLGNNLHPDDYFYLNSRNSRTLHFTCGHGNSYPFPWCFPGSTQKQEKPKIWTARKPTLKMAELTQLGNQHRKDQTALQGCPSFCEMIFPNSSETSSWPSNNCSWFCCSVQSFIQHWSVACLAHNSLALLLVSNQVSIFKQHQLPNMDFATSTEKSCILET